MYIKDYIYELNGCEQGWKWAKKFGRKGKLAWESCRRADWMIWLLESVQNSSLYKSDIIRVKCCMALELITNEILVNDIKRILRWCDGEIKYKPKIVRDNLNSFEYYLLNSITCTGYNFLYYLSTTYYYYGKSKKTISAKQLTDMIRKYITYTKVRAAVIDVCRSNP